MQRNSDVIVLDALGIVGSLCKKFHRSSVDVKYDIQSADSCNISRHIVSVHRLEIILKSDVTRIYKGSLSSSHGKIVFTSGLSDSELEFDRLVHGWGTDMIG